MKFDGQEQEEEDEGLLKPYATHIDMDPFTTLVLSHKETHVTRKPTPQNLITGSIIARRRSSATNLGQKCSVTSELPQTSIKQGKRTDTMSKRTKYRVNLQALIPASVPVEVKLYTIRPITM